MLPEAGKFYIDGNGAVHGPLVEHPSQPERYLNAVGATYLRDGRHVSGGISPEHARLDLVREVTIQEVE